MNTAGVLTTSRRLPVASAKLVPSFVSNSRDLSLRNGATRSRLRPGSLLNWARRLGTSRGAIRFRNCTESSARLPSVAVRISRQRPSPASIVRTDQPGGNRRRTESTTSLSVVPDLVPFHIVRNIALCGTGNGHFAPLDREQGSTLPLRKRFRENDFRTRGATRP
jgi:hypothetical protein